MAAQRAGPLRLLNDGPHSSVDDSDQGSERRQIVGMSLQNLASTCTSQPLSDLEHAANVVDLIVGLGARERGTFAALLCHPDDTYQAAVTVDLPSQFFERASPSLDTADICRTVLRPIIPVVRTVPDAPLVLALGR